MRSAPGFQKRMIPSMSAAIIASEFVDRMASASASDSWQDSQQHNYGVHGADYW
jgi:hypothetical protein